MIPRRMRRARSMTSPFGVALALLVAAAVPESVPPLAAQENGVPRITLPATLESSAAPNVPWRVGERLRYNLKAGVFSVGEAWLGVERVDSIRGVPSYHFSLGIDGSMLFGTVQIHDRYYSWMDVRKLASRRYIRVIDQPGYDGYREFEIYPEERRWERTDEFDDKTGESLSDTPLDEIAFIQFIRTLDLEVGREYTYNNYFKDDGNPVTVRVLRREVKEVPAGTFNTIVVQPIIRTSGMFDEGGEAELYFSDDENRYLVYLRTAMPGFRSMTLHLESIERGDGSPEGGR